jgi:Zn-dependent protease
MSAGDGMTCDHLKAVLGGGSLQLARIFGIRIGVHVSWFVILFLAILWLQGPFEEVLGDSTEGFGAAVLVALLFFASILVHELGHAFAARREGIEVSGIELFFFGGFMRMNRDSATPGQEFRVAVAGPLMTLAIVVASGALSVALEGTAGFWHAARLSGGTASLAEVVIAFTFSSNVLLLGFNLIPAFPLDGGRIARAAAWRLTGDRVRATLIAARLGQAFSVLLMGYGLYVLVLRHDTYGGLYTIVLGWMLGSAARGAVTQSTVTSRLEGVTVADVMDSEPVTIPATLPAGQAFEEFFLRYQGWPWFAVVEADGRFAGLAHRAAVETAPPLLPVRAVTADGGPEERVPADTPLEALLASEPLRRLGALMAVDSDGRLRGVVTLEQVSRALQSRLAPRPG